MPLEAALDAAVKAAMDEKRIVGAVLLVRHKGELLYEKAHGWLDREARLPMVPHAIFRLSSLTKPIVAATILAMKDHGLLRLDDTVTHFLPDFRPKMPDGTQPDITIGQLLTHTSGLNNAPMATPEELRSGTSPLHQGTEAVLARIAERPMLFAPGTGWAYGPSIDVLGAIAGKLVNGQPQDAILKYVLDPLGMIDTRFAVTDELRLAVPYGDAPEEPQRMGDVHVVNAPWGGSATYDTLRIFDAAIFQSGGGGMAGTAQDFMRLLEALRTGGGPVLTPETAAFGLANNTPQLAEAVGPGWGFSYFGAWLDDPRLAQHPGKRGTNRWGGIYGHSWILDPANELSIVSMTNTGLEGSDGRYRDDICTAIYSALEL